eukprot:CAMPEP_0179280228 /NCGR_PEP_ID=MMETSP0797-20121207/36519_1 /TAXON_ID=47934 /ORGANISM="Dinophysis acuminata, Strain DAEP01" /LENGTH=94 /DNA_ID=CAMNT_0020988877 /DNA_START=485 /DNA_END=765 /DNA_ORIENTATION=+
MAARASLVNLAPQTSHSPAPPGPTSPPNASAPHAPHWPATEEQGPRHSARRSCSQHAQSCDTPAWWRQQLVCGTSMFHRSMASNRAVICVSHGV